MSSDDRTQIVFNNGVQAGTQLNGIYEIDEKIAAGGMGEVYRGHNIQTGDPVAIKIVLPDFAKDPTILALFRKEASVLNHLAHNAIVRYYVFSIDPGIARPYLAMEFVDGKSLADVMQSGPMATRDATLLIARVASGLAAAHEAGVIHRDLSPDNIILSGGSVAKAKIIDFGIARSETVGGGTLLGGRFAGKYNFVSPEQLGLFGGALSERSDIYSLGLVFAAALRGEALDMSGSQVDVIEKRRVVPPLEGVPEDMRPLVEAMLQPDPADRPESMSLICEWLTPIPTWQYGTNPGENRATMPGTTSLPPSDRTVLTRPPSPLAPSAPPRSTTGWPSAAGAEQSRPPSSRPPFSQPPAARPQTSAVPRSLPPRSAPPFDQQPARPVARSNPPDTARSLPPATVLQPSDPFAAGTEKTSYHPFRDESYGYDAPAEEPYRYVPSNPDPDEADGVSPGGPAAAPVKGGKTSGKGPLGLVLAVVGLLVVGGAAAYVTGVFGGSGETAVAVLPEQEPPAADTATPPAAPPTAETPAPQATPPTGSPSPAPAAPSTPPSAPETSEAPPAAAPGATEEALAPEPPKDERVARVGSAVDWLKNYDGGACFFARTVSVSDQAMAIEGFGRSVDPFRRMDTAFRRANGYEPTIDVRPIADKQCDLADFMHDVEDRNDAKPALDLSQTRIKSGESLQGVVDRIASRSVSLWLIDDQGIVYDLNQHLKRAGDRATFNIKLVNAKTGAPLPHLIFAVSSAAPLVSLSHSEPKRLASFLAGLKAEVSREKTPIGVATSYFQLGS